MTPLNSIKIRPHPSAVIFKNNNISVGIVARAVDLSYAYVSSILSGLRKPTPQLDALLNKLAAELEKEVA